MNSAPMKIAKVYEPCSKAIKQTELMEGFGDTYSQNYDLRPRRKESLVDWWTKVFYRLDWCDLAFQDVEGGMAILEAYMSEMATSEARAWVRVWLLNMEAKPKWHVHNIMTLCNGRTRTTPSMQLDWQCYRIIY